MQSRFIRRHRAGNIICLSAFLMIAMIAMLAFAVDIGYLQVVETELQRTADSAALAATWELLDESIVNTSYNYTAREEQARLHASEYAQRNKAGGITPSLALEDVAVGHLNLSNPAEIQPYDPNNPIRPNAVRVRIQRTAEQNNEISLFFAQALGIRSLPGNAVATAAFSDNISGIQTPSNGMNIGFLPFAFDVDTWNLLLQGHGTDDWTWDPVTQRIRAGSDGILEVNLYPQGTGSPGNRGTVHIGDADGNSGGTRRLREQILNGLSAEDLAPYGGKLQLNAEGKLFLDGDPGISGGMENALASIAGQSRIVPIFNAVQGPGCNAVYTIIQFAGIRIMDVRLSGSMSSKRVIIQPAMVIINGGIPSDGSTTSYYIHSPVRLVK